MKKRMLICFIWGWLCYWNTSSFSLSVYNHAYQENYAPDTLEVIMEEAVDAYVLLESDEVPIDTIADLKRNNNRVAAYLSIGTAEKWRTDFEELKPYTAQNQWAEWKDEYFVQKKHPQLIKLMKARIDKIAMAGYDWVEFDNMDFAFDELARTRYGILISEKDATAYYQELCDYAHEKGLKVMAKNTFRGIEKFDGVTFESYEDAVQWWSTEDFKSFLEDGKMGIIIHYNAENPPQTYLNYKGTYGDQLSIIIESKSLMRYIHY